MKSPASDLKHQGAASLQQATLLKQKLQELQEQCAAVENRIHSLEANLKAVEDIADEVHAKIRKR